MFVPLPFPKCKRCGMSSDQGYHEGCGGKLSIDPDSRIIVCSRCGHSWNIWNSDFHCGSCGFRFTAYDLSDAVEELLEECRACARELERQSAAQFQRITSTEESWRSFVEGFMYKMGNYAGAAVGTVAKLLFTFFFG